MVGVNKYAHFRHLTNAVKDAHDLIDILTTNYHFEPENIVTLFDEAATRKNIFDKFEYFANKLEKGDNLVIYFSGHGYLNTRTNIGYWIPVDAETVADYIPNSTIRDYLATYQAHHTLLIADACFSRSLFGTATKKLESERFLEQVDQFPSRWAHTSGRLEAVSDGQEGSNSPFAGYLLKYFRQHADEPFSVYDLVQYVKKATANNAEQTPLGGPLQGVGDEGGEFVFYPKESEKLAWNTALEVNTTEAFTHFLEKYPDSIHVAEAKKRIDDLINAEEEAAYQHACSLDTVVAYFDFLEKYPDGKHADAANQAMKKLEMQEQRRNAEKALAHARQSRSLTELRAWKDTYTEFDDLTEQANQLINELQGIKMPKTEPLRPQEPVKKTAPVAETPVAAPNPTPAQPTSNKTPLFIGLVVLIIIAAAAIFIWQPWATPPDNNNSYTDKSNRDTTTTTSVTTESRDTAVESATTDNQATEEEEAFQQARAANTIEAFREFLRKYPQSRFRERVEQMITELEKVDEKKIYEDAIAADNVAVYRHFLERHPNSIYRSDIEKRLKEVEQRNAEKAMYLEAVTQKNYDACLRFLKNYPNSRFTAEVAAIKKEIDDAYQQAMRNADASYQLEDYESAKKYYKEALKLKPRDAQATRKLNALEQLN